MSNDVKGIIYKSQLTKIADSIRNAEGTTDLIPIDDMPTRISSLGEKPTLNAVIISLDDKTLTITNPTTNGNFVESYDIYSGDTLIYNTISVSIDLSTLFTEDGTYTIKAKAKGNNFKDSAFSDSVTYEKTSGLTDLTNTTWLLNTSIDTSNTFNFYNLKFYNEYDDYAGQYSDQWYFKIENYNGANCLFCHYTDSGDSVYVYYYPNGYIVRNNKNYSKTSTEGIQLRTITFTGADYNDDDITNSDLIAWLQANATLQS